MFGYEIAQNKILKWALGALVLGYFVVFSAWISSPNISRQSVASLEYLCPMYYQDCESFYLLDPLPHGYSQNVLYMALFAILIWVIYLMSAGAWSLAALSVTPAFLWHALNVFIISDHRTGNYEYYLVAFGLILIFFPHKEFFLKLTLVMFYVLSTAAKIHPSWIEGGYFTALRTGFPFFPDWSIPLFTNLVILMEMVGSWFLMSRNKVLQRGALTFFTFFHLYSGLLVLYRYPTTVLPFVLIVFGPWYRYTPAPLDRKSIIGWSFIVLLLLLQLSPKLIPGDEKLTLEGNKQGLYMFEANHQCISHATVRYGNGESRDIDQVSEVARGRCQPYTYWFPLKKLCEADPRIARIEWKFDHSINGGPFYRIVNTENVCGLEYRPSSHNTWIQTPPEAEVIGYPVRNVYY